MIGTRVLVRSTRVTFLALSLIVALAGSVPAEAGDSPPGVSLGAESIRQRVRDRARMQEEYDEMREERRLVLAEARESVAAASSGEDAMARNNGATGKVGGRRDGTEGGAAREVPSDSSAASGGTKDSFRNYMACAIFLMLGTALYLRFRGKRSVGT